MSNDMSKIRADFPQEIFDRFIYESADSSEALKNLSLVSKSWLPCARTVLFHRLQISSFSFHSDDIIQRKRAMLESFDSFHNTDIVAQFTKGLVLNHSNRIDTGSKFGGQGSSTLEDPSSPICYHPFHTQNLHLVPRKGFDFLTLKYGFRPNPTDVLEDEELNLHIGYYQSFLNALQISTSGFRRVDLAGLYFYGGDTQVQSSKAVLDPFLPLVVHNPSLESLGLTDPCTITQGVQAINADTEVLQQLQDYFELKRSSLDSHRSHRISLKRLSIRHTYRTHGREFGMNIMPLNGKLQALLFGTNLVSYRNLIYLALDSSKIPVFAGRLEFSNVKYLTIFDCEADSMSPEVWAYNKARMHLPSLTHLQLLLHGYSSILTLLRVILGPFKSNDREGLIEYPGPKFYSGIQQFLTPSPLLTYPQIRHLHLHFDFSASRSVPQMGSVLASRLDDVLRSHIAVDGDSPEVQAGSLEWVTVNQMELLFREKWPLTAGTGRLIHGQGDFWWDSQSW